MNSEKVKEIKKCLECCKQNEIEDTCKYCLDCPASDWDYEKTCTIDLFQKTITLINELESENETLKLNIQETEKASYNINQMNGNLVIENQQLKDRIAELEEDKEKWQRKAVNYYQMAKSYGIECIIDNDIDETLKEYENETI